MATRTTLNVSLPIELGRFVESMVADGHYASASEVVRAGLRLLKDREQRSDDGSISDTGIPIPSARERS